MTQQVAHFRLCSSCRRPLDFGARYYTCSVSTCNRPKLALTFCSLPCFEAHVPTLRHREAWAEEQTAPTYPQWQAEQLARESAAENGRQVNERDERIARSAGNSSSNSVRGVGPTARTPSVERQAATAAGQKPAASKELPMSNEVPKEVLVVVSKVKTYIRAKSQMNTSDAVTEALSELVRATCDQAIEKAKSEGRKTVMARDIAGAPSTATE